MTDHVRVTKREYSSAGGDPADETSYIDEIDVNEDHIDVRGIFLQGDSGADEVVHLTRDGSGCMTFEDSENTTPLSLSTLVGGGGLTPTTHNAVDQLVHTITESCYYEVTYGAGNKVTAETWWTDVSKTTKVREVTYTYTGQLVTQEVQVQYDGTGSTEETLTINYSYTASNRIASATQVRT